MKKKKRTFRVVTFLERGELEFLDEVLKDLYFNHGIRIPRARLVQQLVDAFQDMAEENKKDLEDEVIRRFKEAEDSFKNQLFQE